jgi:hypothetical protein
MQPLEKSLRNTLEKTVKDARKIAETAAQSALGQLGVADAAVPGHLSEAERQLRRKLRIHGRQLGDARSSEKVQSMDRLIEEVAYEHWHRMLFARFLAENNLLMYPDPDGPVAISLEECEDLAADEGAANGWELAARFAARMLPQIFRPDSPVFQLTLPPEHQQKLERLVAGLPRVVFTASDSLGWVYQFWQAKRKEEVNASQVKIGARELPAVTQLFTEPYMVAFLLDNSLGAWWAARRLSESDLKHATSEEELRRKAAIPGVPLDYLRFVQLEDASWAPASGTFDAWPKSLSELKSLDPCCGSGHFLVAALLMLVPMRMEREGMTARESVDAVLRENVHGLELDQRCVELAAFALALTAWSYPNSGGYRLLPELNLACSGLSVSVAKEEWKQLGLGRKDLSLALDWMHDAFQDAPILGSLLNPARTNAAKLVRWEDLSGVLAQALSQEQSEEKLEVAIVAQGLAKAASLLAGQYHWIITNVPYLVSGKQQKRLQDFCEEHYVNAKGDLATAFLDRCLELCTEGGTASIVMPQNWLFQTNYRKFREELLKSETWHLIARLGAGAFETISGEVVKAILINLSRGNSHQENGGLFGDGREGNLIRGVDVSEPRTAAEKAAQLIAAEIRNVGQAAQLENPDARVSLEEDSRGMMLGEFAYSHEGLTTGDIDRFVRGFFEIQHSRNWAKYIQNSLACIHYHGRTDIIHWGNDGEVVADFPGSFIKGKNAWGNVGLRVTQMSHLPITVYTGEVFGKNAATVIPQNISHLPAIWCFCSSPEYNEAVRQIDQSLKVTNGTLVKVSFDIERWTKVADYQYPNGLPKPYSDDPTQWIFHGHPCGSVIWDEDSKWTAHGSLRTDDTVLQVAVARLLGYRWSAELDPAMELAEEQREWVRRCEVLLPHADEDGIVCITPVRGEASAADRLVNLLVAAYGDSWSSEIQNQLLKSVDHAGKSMESWLREKFFTQHFKLFQHRPFIWHIWDGLRDGFAALVNYHKLDRRKLETLTYTYLGDWISRQKQEIINGVDGAQEKLDRAMSLKKSLELILEGEAPFDIFVRWKPLHEQPIGWEPDLNDGVRMNIRPFMTVPDAARKGKGILRGKPNIKWEKDRGKDVESAPWYKVFNGDRINDHHLTLAEKNAARGSKT